MSDTRICEGCPNRGTIRCEIVGRPFDSERGYAALADNQGGMTDVLDLTRAEFSNQVTTDALIRKVEDCEGPQEVNTEKGFMRRLGEKIHILQPEQFCPALGSLAISDIYKVPSNSMEKLREDTQKLRIFDAFMQGLERANKVRNLR